MTGLLWLRDARLTPLALSALPAWLWSPAATRVLWANAAGAAMLGAPTPAALAVRPIEPTHSAVADVARLAKTLRPNGTPRLERLRGFGTVMGRPITCSCARITLDDGASAVLIAAVERAGPELSLHARASRLVAACVEPVALFDGDGGLIAATTPARRVIGDTMSLAGLGASALFATASERGHAAGNCDIGAIAIDRMRDPPCGSSCSATTWSGTLRQPKRRQHPRKSPPRLQQLSLQQLSCHCPVKTESIRCALSGRWTRPVASLSTPPNSLRSPGRARRR
jgi:hypothetical protein